MNILFNEYRKDLFLRMRMQMIRLPEVLSFLNKAQHIWDDTFSNEVNFINFIQSDDIFLEKNKYIRKIVFAVMQIGIYSRYLKSNPYPKYIIGNVKGASPAACCADLISLRRLVAESYTSLELFDYENQRQTAKRFVKEIEKGVIKSVFGDTEEAPEYRIFKLKENAYEPYKQLPKKFSSLNQALSHLKGMEVESTIVNIGPCSNTPEIKEFFRTQGFDFIDSLAMEENLSWFFEENQVI